MPYPVPPDLPPIVAILPCEDASCNEVEMPEKPGVTVAPLPRETPTSSTLAHPAKPERFTPEPFSASAARVDKTIPAMKPSAVVLPVPKLPLPDRPFERRVDKPKKTAELLAETSATIARTRSQPPILTPKTVADSLLPKAETTARGLTEPVQPPAAEPLSPKQTEALQGLEQALTWETFQPNPSLKLSVTKTPTGRYRLVQQTETSPFPQTPRPVPPAPPEPLTNPTAQPSSPVPDRPDPTIPTPEDAAPAAPSTPPPTSGQPGSSPPTTLPPGISGIVELTADRQEFNEQQKVFTAEGNVVMRFQGAVLDADRLQVNLVNRLAVAQGNVALRRGDQVLRGQRFEYNFVQGTGTVLNASGEIYLPSSTADTNPALANDASAGRTIDRPLSDRLIVNQPTGDVRSPGSFTIGVGTGRDVGRIPDGIPGGGTVRRLRFQAARIDFTPKGWEAENIQITNDPFSPPELVLRADRARLNRITPLRDEVVATRPRLVFEQGLAIPLISRVVLDRNQRQPPLILFGYDSAERGGLFVERPFEVLSSEAVQLTLTPQIFIQQAISGNNGTLDPANLGLKGRLNANLGPRTSLRGNLVMTSLDLDEAETKLRASVRARQFIGDHKLDLEYSYRDRLFNGSLGFQTVQSSVGIVFSSPVYRLGDGDTNFSYQAGFQNINADTDRLDLLPAARENNRINLSRFQASAAISRGIYLWRGQALPATPTEGLRYTPVPIVPNLRLNLGLTGVTSLYSNGDSQNNLIASVGVSGQFGRFSRPYLDYTGISVSYSQVIGSGLSPFQFDRTVDNRVLSIGVVQQVYGPFRVGFQTSFNLDNADSITTDYFLEYSRRAYGITLRVNPVLQVGSIGFRISDFNWTGGTEPFPGTDITPVEGGIIRR